MYQPSPIKGKDADPAGKILLPQKLHNCIGDRGRRRSEIRLFRIGLYLNPELVCGIALCFEQ